MPSDSSAALLRHRPSLVGGVQGKTLRALSLGVFNYGGEWKVYAAFERAAAYATRAMAVEAARGRAVEAAGRGQAVELFIQDENGELSQAAVDEAGRPTGPAPAPL